MPRPPAKRAPAKRAPAKAAATASSPSGSFGLIIDVNNNPVTITTLELTSIATNGLSFSYDPDTPTEIGKLSDLITWINNEFKVDIPLSEIEGLPVIGPAVQAIVDLTVSVSEFDVSIAGSTGTNSFNLQGTITLGSPPSLFGLSLTGFSFGVTYPGGS